MASGILKAGKYSSSLARAGAQVHPEGLIEPLMAKKSRWSDDESDDEDDSGDDEEDNEGAEAGEGSTMSSKDLMKKIGAGLLAVGGAAASASAMIAAPTAAVMVMGGLCIANAPTVVIKQHMIAKSAGTRAIINGIREDISFLNAEIGFLELSIDDLQAEADILVGIEQDLGNIATTQGTNVEEIVQLVNENEEILSQMKSNLTQTFCSAMVKIVLRSDKDGDMIIDEKEAPLLALRLQIQLQPYGIKLDTGKFEEMLRESTDISGILMFCGTLLFADEEASKDDSDDGSVDSEVTFDFESFCQGLNDEDAMKMTQEEKASMAIVDDKYSRGSVTSARGKRRTLMPGGGKKDSTRKTILREVKKRQTVLKTRQSKGTRGSKPPSRPNLVRAGQYKSDLSAEF